MISSNTDFIRKDIKMMEQIECRYQSYKIIVYHKPGKTDEKVVFLHGGGLDSAMMSWQEVIAEMGDEYELYAIDLLGYGASDKPDVTYSLQMYTELLHNVLGQLGIHKASFAGLSMGGGVSLAFALKYPQMVEKLTLVDALGLYERMPHFHYLCWKFVNSHWNEKAYDWFRKSRKLVRWSASELIGDKKKLTDEFVESLYKLVLEPGCGKPFISFQRQELGRKKLTTGLACRLGELRMPVLLVNGEKDSSVPAKAAIAASKVIPNCRLHIMKGCKHWSQKERPEEFAEVFRDFLQSGNK